MGWQSWDSNWKDLGGNRPDYSNYIFIADPEDMQKEIKLEDIGKELFFLTKHAFCETCDKTLKAYGSEEKAKAQVEKHLGFKKYAGHKAFVKTVDFSKFNKCTTADIVGTKANIDRNQALRDSFYGQVRGQIQREIANNEELIANVQKTFGFITREDEIPECPKDLEDGKIFFANDVAKGELKVSRIKDIAELFAGTWGKDNDRVQDQDLYQRASMMFYYLNVGGHYRFDNNVYDWEYKFNYDAFIGHDTEKAGDCSFCEKTIDSWNDVFVNFNDHKYVHRDCLKHAKEASRLQDYAKKYQKEQEVIAS